VSIIFTFTGVRKKGVRFLRKTLSFSYHVKIGKKMT
jgi:hypothetical protein